MKRHVRLRWFMAMALLGGTIGLPLAHHLHHAHEAEHAREHGHDHHHGEPPGAPHGEDSPLHGALHVIDTWALPVVDHRAVPLAIRPVPLHSQPISVSPRLLPFPRGPPPTA